VTEWLPARVAWEDVDADVALIALEEGWQAPGGESVLRWGQLAGSEPVPCAAVGFPWASVRQDRMRDAAHLYGQLAPLGPAWLASALAISSRSMLLRSSTQARVGLPRCLRARTERPTSGRGYAISRERECWDLMVTGVLARVAAASGSRRRLAGLRPRTWSERTPRRRPNPVCSR
jgi:hypothetical protein